MTQEKQEDPSEPMATGRAEINPADPNPRTPAERDLNVFQLIGSVLAAGLGVQSSKNRERDFKQGRAGAFILAGLLFTALFIGGVYTVVSLVLAGR